MLAELRSSTITSHSNLKEQHFTSLKDCCTRTTMMTTVMSCEPPEAIEIIGEQPWKWKAFPQINGLLRVKKLDERKRPREQ